MAEQVSRRHYHQQQFHKAATTTRSRFQHFQHHHEFDILQMTSDDLASRLSQGYLPTIVVDTRDNIISSDGQVQAQVRGALFCPAPCFHSDHIRFLIEKAKERKRVCNTGISNHKCCVVFYDKSSTRRSTKCATRFWQTVRQCGGTNEITVKVLRGGAKSWFRSFGKNHRLVQDFAFDEKR
uniref:Rhodanese domain-containing protein n=1 Tax=Chaetoceros debilis TaxID=122233 RepID=A0A7S3V5Y3_9STRA|mmetsp:Transcript_20394/g.30960  ORF Transcript_20394/g.30960 Transcript_20394/m.30960 type:complete len:181 (-) Transcript_20394:207-749(-)